MLLWIIIIFGALIAYLLRKRSLYANWTTAFNTAASIYFSVMLTPRILQFLPEGTDWQGCHAAGFILISSIIIFAVLEVVAAYLIVVEEVDITYFTAVEIVGSKAAGFVTGFCAAGLAVFIATVLIMQFEYQPWMKFIRTEDKPLRVAVAPVEKTCGAIHFASLQRYSRSPANVVETLTSLSKQDESGFEKRSLDNPPKETVSPPPEN